MSKEYRRSKEEGTSMITRLQNLKARRKLLTSEIKRGEKLSRRRERQRLSF